MADYRQWSELADHERARGTPAELVRACMDRADESLELAHKLERAGPLAPVREAVHDMGACVGALSEKMESLALTMRAAGLLP
jgi:hypothetical protein